MAYGAQQTSLGFSDISNLKIVTALCQVSICKRLGWQSESYSPCHNCVVTVHSKVMC